MVSRRTCHALAVAGAFMCVHAAQPSAVHAQTQTTQPELPVSLERIREGIQHEPKLKIDFLDPSIPLFRIAVQEKQIALEDYWKFGPDTAVSRDVRPAFASTWHNEFMRLTTPKQQVAASPFGIFGNPAMPVGPPVLAIGKALKSVFTNAERGRIRRQIQEELKALEANPPQAPAEPAPASAPVSASEKDPKAPDAKAPVPKAADPKVTKPQPPSDPR